MVYTLKIIALLLAYSLGIATLVVQFINYKKRNEYIQTIWFSIAFILVIISTTINSLFKIQDPSFNFALSLFQVLLIIVFALSIIINIHKERKINFTKARNQWAIILSLACMVGSLWVFLAGLMGVSKILSSSFLFLAVQYAMVIILTSKPSKIALLKHEKNEKTVAVLIIIIMWITFGVLLSTPQNEIFLLSEKYGAFSLSGICIMLSLSKLRTDLKQLSLYNRPPEIGAEELQDYNISPREKQVLELLNEGKIYKEIAEILYISLPTVKTHASNIYQKMGVKNRAELMNLIKTNTN
jgi:DNA-binding CsgD family transcriptional regulator